MSSLLIKNGVLVTLDEEQDVFQHGNLYIEDTKIVDVGEFPDDKYQADKTIDAAGNLVMPGLINCHHHLYSTLARGFTPPGEPPANFVQILERLWWKLDAALTEEDVYYSAIIAILNAARAGCTTIIDHHASPSCVDGSLDVIEQAFREVGLNACLCYEVSDRHEEGQGINENERFIKKCQASGDDQITALFGMHALLTLGTKTMQRCADVVHHLGVGIHCHASESEDDRQVTFDKYQRRVMDRFLDFGLLGEKCLFVHGVDFADRDMDLMKSSDSMLVNNPESNMNNGLGITPILELLNRGVLVGVGTDGMSSHLISQARAMYLLQRTYRRDPRVMFVEAAEILLKNNRAITERIFKEPRGVLAPGYQADIMIPEYVPFTPLRADTFYGHLLFGLSFARISTTISRGKVIVEEGHVVDVDEEAIRAKCLEHAEKLWSRIT